MITTAAQEPQVTVTPRNRANFRRLKTNSIQSVKRWEKENELLYAMMEDESEWLGKLFPDVVISPEFYFYALEDGSLLCRLANYIQEKAELYSRKQNVPVPGKKFRYHTMSKCSREIKLFKSRENVQQFLTWCRSHGIPEAILFESNDVVEVDDYREGCRGIIICLMEIVRRTAKFDLDELPQLIQLEKEIEEDEAKDDTDLSNGQGQILDVEKVINMTSEIDNLAVQQTDAPEIQSPNSLDSDSGVESVFDLEEGENSAARLTEFTVEDTEEIKKTTVVVRRKQSPPKPKDQKSSPKSKPKTKELPSLLESTEPKSELDKQICKLAQDYNIKLVHRLKEGKYIILGRVMFVRMLNDHMLVRIGGGWDTLEHYLMTHAPSKQALDNSSAPSSPAFTSPRSSITGSRSSLIEKVKRKEQIGIVKDSPVYHSQGSLSQLSPNLSSSKKKLSVAESDEKDITDAIRKISSSVSQNLSGNLASRPVSFTSKAFHQLKSRFDKGIFGTSRRTSSPDLTLKGKKISRRLSDTTTMADIATTLAFDGSANDDQKQANNNDSERQTESGETEETGKVTAPTEDLLGDSALQKPVASDAVDGSALSVDLPSTVHANDSNWPGDLLGGAVNGTENYQAASHAENLVDISSFDPFTPAPDQAELISIDVAPSENVEEQPKITDHGFDLARSESEEPVSTPRIDLGDLLADSQPVESKTVESSPPVILEDLVPSEPTETQTEGELIETSPATVEEQTTPESMSTEEVKPDEPVIPDEPAVVETEPESPKLEEPVPSEEAVVKSEGESTEAALVSDETTTQEQSEEVVTVVESVPENVEEETKPVEGEAKPDDKPVAEEALSVEEVAKPVEEEPKPVEEDPKPTEEEPKPVEKEAKPTEEVAKPVEEEPKLTEEEAKPVEEVKPAEPVKPSKGQAPKTDKPEEKATKTKPQTAGARPKSPSKAAPAAKQPAAKKPAGPARTTSPTKTPSTAAAKKDVKPPATKTPAAKPAATAAKAPATKTTTAAPGAKKPATKPEVAKTAEAKKPEKPKSAATTRPPTKPAGTSAPGAARPASAATKKPPGSTTAKPGAAKPGAAKPTAAKPAASKAPGKDVKDAGPPKSAPKTTTSKPASAKPTPAKTSAPATKPAAPKPTRVQSAKPSDKTDGAAKSTTSRPQSAKPKTTTTTTTVKKTTTTVTSKSGAAPAKTTTTKTVTEVKSGQGKTTTTTTTKKATTRPASAAKTTPGAKPAVTGPKSTKPAGKAPTKTAPKKKVEEPAKGKEEKKPDEKPEKVEEPATAAEEKPSEVPEVTPDEKPSDVAVVTPDEKPAEVVEAASEESPVEASPEEKSIELTPESPPAEQAPEPAEVPPEGVEQSSHVVTQVVTQTTTVIGADGEEQSTTTTEETTFEQTVGES